MQLRIYFCGIQLLCIYTVFLNAVPTTLLESTKAMKIHANKVKRAPNGLYQTVQAEDSTGSEYYPSAKKRDGGPSNLEMYGDLPTWEQDNDGLLQQQETLRRLNPELFGNEDEKTLNEYEKGYTYGANKQKLDEQMENAILKSELYGDPASLNQYRYYGRDDNRRKRSFRRFTPRLKREIDGNPEDDLFDLISLWEAERKYNKYNHKNRPEYQYPQQADVSDDSDAEDSEETWLEAPVYPKGHNSRYAQTPQLLNVQSPYYYDTKDSYYRQPGQAQQFPKRQWGGFGDRRKRFMVARKRSDPTHELRYLTGSNYNHVNRDDNIYTLAQLLGNSQQRDPNVPLYHRAVL